MQWDLVANFNHLCRSAASSPLNRVVSYKLLVGMKCSLHGAACKTCTHSARCFRLSVRYRLMCMHNHVIKKPSYPVLSSLQGHHLQVLRHSRHGSGQRLRALLSGRDLRAAAGARQGPLCGLALRREAASASGPDACPARPCAGCKFHISTDVQGMHIMKP